MPRKSRAKKSDIQEIANATGLVIASSLPSAEAPPPETEVITLPLPSDSRHRPAHVPLNGKEHGFSARVLPDGPRKREPGETASVFASSDVRIEKDGRVFEVTFAERPNAEVYAQMQKWGFDDATEHNSGERWLGYQSDLLKQGTDINLVAVALGKPDVSKGWER